MVTNGRRLRFRAWDSNARKWVSLDSLHVSGGTVVVPDGVQLSQSTLVKDSTGVEMYEGDIVRVLELTNDREEQYTSVIKYESSSGFVVADPKDSWLPVEAMCPDGGWYPLCEGTIIGNIYENPRTADRLTQDALISERKSPDEKGG